MQENKKSLIKKLVVGTFISVPILSSLISTLHLVSLFDLGNLSWMSILLAISFEIGSIAAFLIPTVLPNIKKGLVYTIFIILSFMQIIGNIFYSYDFIYNKLLIDKNWLNSFNAFATNFAYMEPNQTMLLLSSFIGIPIPLISLFFLKSWMDYLKLTQEEIQPVQIIEEPPKIESNILPMENKNNIDETIQYIKEDADPAIIQNNNLK